MPFTSGSSGGGGGSGTVTSIAVAADNGVGGSITTSGTISILGGNNVDTNVTGTTVTINDNYITRTITANYTVTSLDRVIFCDVSGGSITVTLAASVDGKLFTLKDINTSLPISANTITILPPAGLIDGGTSLVLDAANQSVTLIGDGTNYWVI